MDYNQYELYRVERRQHEQKAKNQALADLVIAQKQYKRTIIFSITTIVVSLSLLVVFFLLSLLA